MQGVHGIDSGIIESAHARIVVFGVVHAVNTDDVDAELRQVGDIAGTSSGIGQGIYEGGRLKEGVVGIVGKLA